MAETKKYDNDTIKDLQDRLTDLIESSIDTLCKLKRIERNKITENYENMKPEAFDKWLCEKFYKGFDPDSSRIAWKHYKNHYGNDNIATKNYNLNLNQLRFYNYVGNHYLHHSLLQADRLFAFPKNTKPITNNKYKYKAYGPTERLSGDTDFNFQKIYTASRRFLPEEEIKCLELCYKMQHSIYNFSLMQSMGRLQQIKGSYGDRLDVFLKKLNEYYKKIEKRNITNEDEIIEEIENAKKDESLLYKIKKENSYKNGISKGNVIELIKYLNSFIDNSKETSDINGVEISPSLINYCEKIYFINDENLIAALVKFGNSKLDSAENVITYMKLAQCFWDAKEYYFLNTNKYFEGDYNNIAPQDHDYLNVIKEILEDK